MDGEKYREKRFTKKPFHKGKHFQQHQNKEVEMKQPTILVREHKISETSGVENSNAKQSASQKPSTIILKTREPQENRATSPNVNQSKEDGNEKTNSATGAAQQPVYQIATKVQNNAGASNSDGQLQAPPLMLAPVKILDECLHVCDSAVEYLMDQNDYLVVGAFGPQGCGKSHILSELAGSPGIFKSDGPDFHAGGTHCTVGVDMYVTPARVIFLDTQPIFSASVMECISGSTEKKYTAETSVAEKNAEISDLHLIAFLLTVCHVVIYVDDWLLNLDAMMYIRNAEMLKLSPTSAFLNDHAAEYFPTLVIINNNAAAEDFKPETRAEVNALIEKCFRDSKLKIDSRCNYNFGRANCPDQPPSYVFPLPMKSNNQESTFHGYVSYKNLISSLRQQIHSMPRKSITPTSLSEKHWYQHACKVIENIRKGILFMEYNRLLT